MSDEEIIELLDEARDKIRAFRDVLSGYELKIRNIDPPRGDSVDLNVTTADIADHINHATCWLEDAMEAIDTILTPPKV